MRAGGDKRGSSYDRRRRKERMLSDPQFEHDLTHPERNVLCTHCGEALTYDTVEADRKIPGGPYAYHNIQPACRTCNQARSNNTSWTPPQVETKENNVSTR